MARRVRVLRAERRSERIDTAQRAGVRFSLQLAADRQVRGASKEVLREINAARLFVARRIFDIERRHLEHFARAFAVAGGDQRSVEIVEAAALEEFMRRERQRVAHTRHRAERVRAGPQMSHFAQTLKGNARLAERIFHRIAEPEHFHFRRLQINGLPLPFGSDQRASYLHGGSRMKLHNFRIVIRKACRRNHLQISLATAVVQFDERKARLRITPGPHPASHCHLTSKITAGQCVPHYCPLHLSSLQLNVFQYSSNPPPCHVRPIICISDSTRHPRPRLPAAGRYPSRNSRDTNGV